MREKKNYRIITFHTTSAAMAMEKYCNNFKGGFMNVHRNSMTIGDKEIL